MIIVYSDPCPSDNCLQWPHIPVTCLSPPNAFPVSQLMTNLCMTWLGPYTWFNTPKPTSQSRALCGTVCALSIANGTLLNWSIVSLLIVFYFILFSNCFCILVHDLLYALLVLVITLVISIWPYYIVIHYGDYWVCQQGFKMCPIWGVLHSYQWHTLVCKTYVFN